MSKIAISILFGASLLASGCTVHHYYHTLPAKDGHKGHHGMRDGDHKGCSCSRQLPEGHPPVDGMKGKMDPHHGMKGKMDPHHGMKGKMDPHHGMKGHDMGPHHGAPDAPTSHAEGSEHQGMQGMPAPVQSFHDAFAAVWHLETDEERKSSACAQVGNWLGMLPGVKAYKVEGEGAAAYASAAAEMSKKTEAVQLACKRKKADVQLALKDAHDALHALFAASVPAS